MSSPTLLFASPKNRESWSQLRSRVAVSPYRPNSPVTHISPSMGACPLDVTRYITWILRHHIGNMIFFQARQPFSWTMATAAGSRSRRCSTTSWTPPRSARWGSSSPATGSPPRSSSDRRTSSKTSCRSNRNSSKFKFVPLRKIPGRNSGPSRMDFTVDVDVSNVFRLPLLQSSNLAKSLFPSSCQIQWAVYDVPFTSHLSIS